MRTSGTLVALLAGLALAGSFVPTPAVLVNARENAPKIALAANGLLAFRTDTAFNVGVRVDLRRLSDGDLWRIVLDPNFKPRGMDSARRAARWLAPQVVLQQLPEGDYAPVRIYVGSDKPLSFSGDTLHVHKGTVTSLGDIRLVPEKNLLGGLVGLRIESFGRTADSLLPGIADFGIQSLPLRRDSLGWSMEKGTLKLIPQ